MSKPIYEQVASEFKYVDLLAKTAYDVASNYLYLDMHDALPITLLDFDIIYGSLLSMTAGSQSLAARYGNQYDLFSKIPVLGSQQLQALLSTLEHYTLPPGAEAELYRWTKIIFGKIHSQFDTLLDDIEGAQRSKDPLDFLLKARQPGGTDLVEFLRQQLNGLQDLTSDHKLLELMRKKWIPCTDLLGEQSEAESLIAYRIVLSTLNVQRRNTTYNNYSDALNAQFAVKLFNSKGMWAGKRVIPTLISGTEPIATLNMSQWLRSPGHEIKPQIFASLLYLRIAQSLSKISDSSNRQIAELADQLFKRVLGLAEQYKVVLSTMKRRCPALDDDSISKDGLVADYLAELYHVKSSFQRDYSQTLQTSSRIAQSDRVSVVNQILTARIHAQLTSGVPVTIKQALREISYKLGWSDESGEITFWDGTSDKYTIVSPPETAFEQAAFSVSITSSAKTLVHTFSGRPLDEVSTHDWAKHPILTMAVHPRFVGAFAVLRIEAEKGADGLRRVTFTWCHMLDYYTIWTICQDILVALNCGGSCEITALVRNSTGTEFSRTQSFPELVLFLDDGLKAVQNLEQGKLTAGDITISIDFQPMNEYEFQVSVSLPCLIPTEVLLPFSEAVSEQIHPSIPAYSVRSLIQTLQTKLLQLQFANERL